MCFVCSCSLKCDTHLFTLKKYVNFANIQSFKDFFNVLKEVSYAQQGLSTKMTVNAELLWNILLQF